MTVISKIALVAASLFAASTVLGQTKPTPPAINVLVGTATANDTQAAATDKFAELLTKYSSGRLKASARTGGALGTNAQMIAALQAPPDVLYRMKFHEVTKYYTITEHFAIAADALVSNIIVSKKWFDGLPKDLQDVVTRAGKDTIVWADDAYTKSQNSSLEAMRKAITVTSMPAAELQKMKDPAHKGVWERMKNDPQKGPLLKLLEEDVARFIKK